MIELKLFEFRELLLKQSSPCISIYLGDLSGSGTDLAARLEAILGQVMDKGRSVSVSSQSLVEGLRRLSAEDVSNLGLFISDDMQAFMRLPFGPREKIVEAASFHLKPIMKVLAASVDSFGVLVLGVRGAFFFEGGGGEATLRRELPMDDAVRRKIDSATGLEARRAALGEYLRRLDRLVRIWMGNARRPLVLAGPAYLRAAHRGFNTYPYLMQEGFAIESPYQERLVYERATNVFSSVIERDVMYDLALLGSVGAHPSVTFDIETASRWAAAGLMHKVYIAEDTTVRGAFDGDCVLDDLAEEVLRQGGQVFCVPRASLPRQSLVVAVR